MKTQIIWFLIGAAVTWLILLLIGRAMSSSYKVGTSTEDAAKSYDINGTAK